MALFRKATSGGDVQSLVHDAAAKYREWHSRENYRAIWDHREALEPVITKALFGKQASELDAIRSSCGADYFWMDAFPAFAGFKQGKTFGSNVYQYAGNADAHVDRSDPQQSAMMDQIDRLASS